MYVSGVTQRFISVEICSGLNRLRLNSDLVVTEKIYSFLRQNASSKFRNTRKLIPFVFEQANMFVA